MVENIAFNNDNRKRSRDRLHYKERKADNEVVLSQVTEDVVNNYDQTEERFVEVAFRTLAPGLPIIPVKEIIEELELRDAQKLADAYNLPLRLSWPLLKRELNDKRNGILKEVLSKSKPVQARKASVSEDDVRESKRQRTSKEAKDRSSSSDVAGDEAPSITVSYSLSRRRPSIDSREDEEEYHIMKLAHQLLRTRNSTEDTEAFDNDEVRRNTLDGDRSQNSGGEDFAIDRKKLSNRETQPGKEPFAMYLKQVPFRSAGPTNPDDNYFGPETSRNTSLPETQATLGTDPVNVPYQMVSPGREPDSPIYTPDSPTGKLARPVYSPNSSPVEQPVTKHKADSEACAPDSLVSLPSRIHGKQPESGMRQDTVDSKTNDHKGSLQRSHQNKGGHKMYTYVLRAPDWSQSNHSSPDEEYDYKDEEAEVLLLESTGSEEPPDSEYDYEEEEVEFLLDPTPIVEGEDSLDNDGNEECNDHTHSPGNTDESSFSKSMRRLTKMGDEARAKRREALEAEEEFEIMTEHDPNYNFEQAFRSPPERLSPCCYNYKGTMYILPATDKQNRTVKNHRQSGRPEWYIRREPESPTPGSSRSRAIPERLELDLNINDVERPRTEASPFHERRGDGEC